MNPKSVLIQDSKRGGSAAPPGTGAFRMPPAHLEGPTMLLLLLAVTLAHSSWATALTTEMPTTMTEGALVTIPPPPLEVTVEFLQGNPVILAGCALSIKCSVLNRESLSFSWYYKSQTSNVTRKIGSNYLFTKFNITVEDSGQYTCMVTDGYRKGDSSVEVTVLERLLSLWVVPSPKSGVVFEGHGLLTLTCFAKSAPPNTSWIWYRMEEGKASRTAVGFQQVLTLSRAAESGDYKCHANSNRMGKQIQYSLSRSVYIISLPVGLPVGIAALVLALLCLLLLFAFPLLAVFFWRKQRKPENAALKHLSNVSSAKGPGVEMQGGSQPIDDDVYMNYDSSSSAYTDLNKDGMTDNAYDCLS
ncbi:hypothetical protein AGOR_G00102440 [Albula goreensis]|uniref:Ig-like domain-containing protein n=1 Tax=Albula goreensis TaxID=1534307 RepID=A0A8T3DL99_9TELE|nr:hypothetical protein AGOR_G00102440 [Albula goreensis]